MDKMIGYCGINCEKCEARIATVRDDDNMREEVSRKWCELFHTDIITPDKINCTGCRGDGVKYFSVMNYVKSNHVLPVRGMDLVLNAPK